MNEKDKKLYKYLVLFRSVTEDWNSKLKPPYACIIVAPRAIKSDEAAQIAKLNTGKHVIVYSVKPYTGDERISSRPVYHVEEEIHAKINEVL